MELRANDIRVRFTTADGVRHAEPLDLTPTAAHLKAARKIYNSVKRDIDAGTFAYAEHFPTSKRAASGGPDTFGHYAENYLRSSSFKDLAPATRSQYENEVKLWRARQIGDRALETLPIGSVRHSQMAALIGDIEWSSARRKNNALIPLRGIFSLWVADDRRNRQTPMEGIDNARFQKGKPDPLTPQESERVLTRMQQKYDVRVWSYFECAVYSWMRPEEEIALLWDKIDFTNRTGRIDIVRSFRGGVKPTKTYEERDIEFTQRAWAAIKRMEPLTRMKPHGHVFENPHTGRPWHDERAQRDCYWAPSLKVLGIRARGAYRTRHTGITLALMRGCDPAWVARMAGHKNTKMIWEVYSKWIAGVDNGRERAKMDEQLAREEVTA